MKFIKKLSLIMMVLVGILYARSANEPLGVKVYDAVVIDGSELCMYITNYGTFGHDVVYNNAGGWWPRDRRNETYIYGAGLWVGALKRNETDPAKWDTVVTFFYNPNNGQSEGAPALVPTWIKRDTIVSEPDYTDYSSAATDPQARVYLSNSDNAGYGWPIKEVTETGDTVDYILSTLDSYTRYTDLDPNRQEYGLRPLGILVDQWTYQFDFPGLKDITFLLWRIKNISNDTLKDVYIGACYDYDIGMGGSELVGFVRTYDFGSGPVDLNLAYQYQIVPEPGWIGVDGNGMPGVIGSVFLENPLATDTVVIVDTIGTPVGPDTILPGEPLGMTAFKIFTLAIDPRNDNERYPIMAGWDPPEAGGRYNPYMEDIYGPDDKRFIQVSGPFDMAPGDETELVVALVTATDSNNIKFVAKKALDVFMADFIGPQPPVQPKLFANSRDNKVYLWWSDISEKSRDRFYDICSGSNPVYREMDFQGYLLLRSIDNQNWDTLTIYDISDGLTVMYTDSLYNPEGNYWVYTDSLFLGYDSGIKHYYVDSTVIPGLVYSYQLIPFDLNFGDYKVVNGDTIPAEPFSIKGTPATVSVLTLGNTGQPRFKASVAKHGLENVFSFDGIEHLGRDTSVANDTFKLIFSYHGSSDSLSYPTNPAFPLISIAIVNKHNDTLLVIPENNITWMYTESDSFGNIYTANIALDLTTGWSILNPRLTWENNYYASYKISTDLFSLTTTDSSTWKIKRGATNWSYTSDSSALISQIANPAAYIYPAVYKITWKYNTTGDSITLQVYDTLRKVYVPYNPYITRINSDYGWAFIQGVYGNPSLGAAEWIPATAVAGLTGIYGLKLPGSKVFEFTDFGGSASPPPDGYVWYVGTYDTTNKVSTLPISGEYYLITFNTDSTNNKITKRHDIFACYNVQAKKITLDIPETSENEGILQIYDITGRLINNVKFRLGEDFHIPENKFNKSGIYFYIVKDRKGQICKSGKIILIR